MSPQHQPTSDEGMRARLALAIVILIAFCVAALIFYPVPSTNRDALLIVIGALVVTLKDVYGYSFGGSAGRDKQADTLNAVAKTAERASAAVMPTDPAIPVAPGESVTVKGESQ